MKIVDFEMSEEGDIVLGDPATAEEGEILYLLQDGSISIEEEEGAKELRDLNYIDGSDSEKQIIYNRIRTQAPDWFHHPFLGGNLTDLIGEVNTRETGEKGADLISQALMYDNLYQPEDFIVRPIPINEESILFYVEVDAEDEEGVLQYPILFNLTSGLLDVYEVEEDKEEFDGDLPQDEDLYDEDFEDEFDNEELDEEDDDLDD